MILEKLQTFILDTLFPICCLFCQKYGEWICEECFKKISILPTQVCPYCEKIISPAGRICAICKDKFLGKNEIWPLDALIVSAKYEKSGISRLVHNFKYNFVENLGQPLAEIISKAIAFHNLPLPDLIVPIPLHPRRLRWRGFNQSEILARHLAETLTPGFLIPVIPDLILRKKYASPQMKIKNYQERQKNVKNIFSLKTIPYLPLSFTGEDVPTKSGQVRGKINTGEGKMLENKTILLIDDISTTGSTLFEAARVLKSAGAKKVFGAVIARQEIHPVK